MLPLPLLRLSAPLVRLPQLVPVVLLALGVPLDPPVLPVLRDLLLLGALSPLLPPLVLLVLGALLPLPVLLVPLDPEVLADRALAEYY